MDASHVSRHSPLNTRGMTHNGHDNLRKDRQLDRELTILEKEKKIKLKELNQNTKHFIAAQASPTRSRSPSPLDPERTPFRASSASQRSLVGSISPRDRSPSLSPLPVSKKSITSPSSPTDGTKNGSNRMLPKRQGVKPKSTDASNVTKTTTTVFPLKLATSTPRKSTTGVIKQGSNSTAIPQIVISDDHSEVPDITTTLDQADDYQNLLVDSTKTSQGPQSRSLSVPVRRGRSNSVPALPPFVNHLRAIAKTESTFEEEKSPNELDIAIEQRPRSSSVNVPGSQKSVPRRQSLINKYTARRGSFRRTSMTLHELIADLKKGFPNSHLFNKDPRDKPISDKEWESLKHCRYLRMPSQDDISQKENTIDIDDIFSHHEI